MRSCATLLLVLATLGRTVDARADWPQFRGPTGDGISDVAGLPTIWSETDNVAWKTPIAGLGRSSPGVLGDRIWLPRAVPAPGPGVSLQVACLDCGSGRVLYQSEVFAVEKPQPVHPLSSHAPPTPLIETGRPSRAFR